MTYWGTSLPNITPKSILDTWEFILSASSHMFQATPMSLGRTVSKDFRDWFRDRLIELSFSLWSWESMWIERGGQRARERESPSDDHWDSTSRRFLNFPSLDTAGGGGGCGGKSVSCLHFSILESSAFF